MTQTKKDYMAGSFHVSGALLPKKKKKESRLLTHMDVFLQILARRVQNAVISVSCSQSYQSQVSLRSQSLEHSLMHFCAVSQVT